MSKLLTYCLLVIAVYVLVIYPLNNKKNDTETDSSKAEKSKTEKAVENIQDVTGNITNDPEKKDENGVSKGAQGQMNYRIGRTK